jgi:hypothetical protein
MMSLPAWCTTPSKASAVSSLNAVRGGSRISAAAIETTSLAASTASPTWPPSASATTMRDDGVGVKSRSKSFLARLITGMTRPRMLITPSTIAGARGTRVAGS